MRICLLGMPGSGKTTLANLLGSMLNVMNISSGALARANGFANSDAEKEGKLDPNEDKIRKLVKEAIGTSNKYIIDGFPRTIDQIEEVGIRFDAVLYLNMVNCEYIAVDRLLQRGRPDDNIETINKRMNTYYQYTTPLIDYFDDLGSLVRINATGTIAQTLRQAMLGMHNRKLEIVTEYVDNIIKKLDIPDDKRIQS